MTNGEGCNHHHQLFPGIKAIGKSEKGNEQNVIVTVKICYMLKAGTEPKPKMTHFTIFVRPMPLRNKLIILLITSLGLFGFTIKHPFYLGICHFKHNAPEKTIEASVKLFVNDFEESLRKTYQQKVDLINGQNKKEINALIQDYLKKHLQLKVNNQLLEPVYLGYEIEKEAAWMYLEYKKVAQMKQVEISNTLLYDFFSTQTHIIRVEYNNSEQSGKLSNPEKSFKASF